MCIRFEQRTSLASTRRAARKSEPGTLVHMLLSAGGMHPSYDSADVAFLGLSTLKGVGFKTLRELGGVSGVDDLLDSIGAEDLVRRVSKVPLAGDIEMQVSDAGLRVIEQLMAKGIHLVKKGDAHYPRNFYDLPEEQRPLWFFYRGDVSLLARRNVTVVGTRSPTEAGAFLARFAVLALRELGLPSVSGLAHGIDEIVHDWSLLAGLPTVSVLGTGLLRTYPASNAQLADRIVASGGVLVSEYLPDAGPTSEGFVWRNRLQAALGCCLIAPEWKASSGTAHTVRFAKRLERPTINLTMGCSSQLASGPADFSYAIPAEVTQFIERISINAQQSPLEQQIGFSFE